MGDKIAARNAVIKNGVPVVPGMELDMNGGQEYFMEAAEKVGFPLLIKAAAGGGGKGMRAVYHMEDLLGALASAQREAESAFGEGTVYLERLIENGRHIEFQVIGDT